MAAGNEMRAAKTGRIERSRWKPGWIAYAPGLKNTRGVKLGHFDNYRAAEKAIAEFMERAKVA